MTFQEKMSKLYERFAYQGKGGTNSHFKYRFVQESQLKRDLNLALRELGLVLQSVTTTYTGTEKAGVCDVTLSVFDPESQMMVQLDGVGGGVDSSDKAPAKAMVAAFKYALLCGLSVETGERMDTEADEESDDREADALLSLIHNMEKFQLQSFKERVHTFRNGPRFEQLKAAYQRRAVELTNNGGQ